MYEHKQYGPWWWLILGVAVIQLGAAFFAGLQPTERIILAAIGLLIFLLSQCFRYLMVRDEGEFLYAKFGPIPLFGARIRYADIEAVEPDRTTVLEGWGLHWTPGRGTTINIWGFDCVKLRVKGRTLRIGTDDRENLYHLIKMKMQAYRIPQSYGADKVPSYG
jgi:hypothetical protein